MQLAQQRRRIPDRCECHPTKKTPRLTPRLIPRLIPRLTPRSTPRGAPLELRCATSVVGVFYFPAPLGRASGRPGRGKVRKSRGRLDNGRVRSCCGHVLTSGASRRCGQKQTAIISLIAALRDQLGQSGAPKPENYEPYGQNSRPWRSFCNGTAVGGQKSKFETFRNFLISVMPGLFVRGCEKPRLERDRSQMVSHRPGGGDPRSHPFALPHARHPP